MRRLNNNMASLDSFLNFIIPIGIIIFFVGLLYSKLKTEIHTFFDWIKGLFESTTDNLPEMRPQQIIYD